MLKAIVPVAGVGARLRPHTHTLPKVLIHVAGKPILGHILDELKLMGVTDVVLVVGYMGDRIVDYVKKSYDFNLSIVEQTERLGLGHAILLTKEFFNDEPALIVLGDTVFKADLKSFLNTKNGASYIGVKEVADPRRFGVVELSEGKIRNFVEKPENPPSNLAIVGLYYLQNSKLLFDSLNKIIATEKKTAGEYQLTDALQLMLESGEEMRTFLVEGWYDCGKPETLLETNRRLLAVCSNYPASVKENNIIFEPVYISSQAKVEYSIIGPHVSIAEGSVVKKAVIKNTIINENAKVKNIHLDESLVGQDATVAGRMFRLNVGDHSMIDFS